MFCWPSRRNSRKKSQLESAGSDNPAHSVVTGGSAGNGILVKPYKGRKKGKKSSATFKCDLSEALLPASDECLLSLRSASCNSSIRELSGFSRNPSCNGSSTRLGDRSGGGVRGFRGNHNKHYVSSGQLSHHFPEEDSDSVNNNNRSAEVLLFYSNHSLSTRNSVADFIENDEFNYKSLWGKDISEWDERESACNTLERETRVNNHHNEYVRVAGNNSNHLISKKTAPTTGSSSLANGPNQKERLAAASSSPSLSSPTTHKQQTVDNKSHEKSPFSPARIFVDDEDEPLPSPPPTPPEAKISLSTDSALGNCGYFKYPPKGREKFAAQATPFRIHSSTSTSSLSESCILTPEVTEKEFPLSTKTDCDGGDKGGVVECATQTLPFWQLEFPGTLPCSCSRTSEDSGIVLNNSSIQQEDSSPGGHESPGGDSSSGISSDDNLESLHVEEEIMLKSLKNSFLHQAIPFQLCNFSINGGGGGSKDKTQSDGGAGVSCANVTQPSSTHGNDCQAILNGFSSANKSEKQKNFKNQQLLQQHGHQQKEKCELAGVNAPALVKSQDRNRLGPVGKNYASSGLDANANESEAPLLRGHGQTNGELESSGKSCTKVQGDPLIDPANSSATTHNLIISKSKSTNNRVSSNNQHNTQNSVLVQENSSLKEEVSRLTSVVSDLQEQISRLTASGEETKRTLETCLATADTRSVALSIVAQQCDKEKLGIYEQLIQQEAEKNVWKQRLDEKLAELQNQQLEYEKEREQNQEEIRSMLSRHEVEVDVTVRNCETKLEQMQKRHTETLADLKRSHTDELEKLQESHRQELELTLHKHRELLDEHRNKSPHDILHKEVESLQIVVEMRNEEIRELRKDLMDYKNTLNDLQMAREHSKSLVAKIEDLEAQLEKARADKRSLQERYQVLETTLQQIESENNRLVRCNEELNWKIKSLNLVEGDSVEA